MRCNRGSQCMAINRPEYTLAEMKSLLKYAKPEELEMFNGLLDEFVREE
jgi:hypothetical protein